VRELRPDVPVEVERAVAWALERDRDRRCPSALELASALRAALPRPPNARELSSLVETYGGPALERIVSQIEAIHSGQDRTVSRPPPEKSGARIVPEAEPPKERLIGPSERPPPPVAEEPPAPVVGPRQRDLSTHLLTPETPEVSRGVAKSPPPRRWRVALAVGVLAWVGAAVMIAWALKDQGRGSDEPVLREARQAPP
jgi:hypothetical protein